MVNISLPAETIFHILSFPISNSLFVTWFVMADLVIFSLLATRKIDKIPSGLQNFTEMIIGTLFNFFEGAVGPNVRLFFPLVATFFLFILLGNWSGLLPGFGSIGIWENKEGHEVLIPLFRRVTADLNTTLALALISVGAVQYYGLRHVKLNYLKKFFNFRGPVAFAVGILEVISEFSRILSFSFRLFGNMFAGEVLIVVMVFLIPIIVPLPFLFLEVFVGFIQAFIFTMLTLVFLNGAVSSHKH